MEHKRTRRRGEALELAILHAAWDVLDESGWEGFTIDRVSVASRTGKAAVYRRWPDRRYLAQDLLHKLAPLRTPRIRLREDLRANLYEFIAVASQFLAGPFGQAVRGVLLEGNPEERRTAGSSLLGASAPDIVAIVDRALISGELSSPPAPAAMNMGQALLTQEFLYSGAVDEAVRVAIVDDAWLPALLHRQPVARRATRA